MNGGIGLISCVRNAKSVVIVSLLFIALAGCSGTSFSLGVPLLGKVALYESKAEPAKSQPTQTVASDQILTPVVLRNVDDVQCINDFENNLTQILTEQDMNPEVASDISRELASIIKDTPVDKRKKFHVTNDSANIKYEFMFTNDNGQCKLNLFTGQRIITSKKLNSCQCYDEQKQESKASSVGVSDFIPIKSYFRTYKLSYETNNDFITIPGAGGIISDFPIKSDVGTEIEFSLRSTFDSIKEKTWVPTFRLYFYERKLDPAKEYLEYYYSTAEKTNYIQLVVRATTFSDPDYKGNPYDTKISRSTYESVTEDKKQYHIPLQWNKIKIVISDRKTIKIFVNRKESLIYRGSFPENIFLGIGNNQDMYGFYVGRDVYINGKTGKINLKPSF